MINKAMERKAESGEALDVETMLASPQEHGPAYGSDVYKLTHYVDGLDYFVGSQEAWIWSIGRRLSDSAIFAATDGRFYENPAFECLWLR